MDKIIRDAQPKKVNDDHKIKLMKTPIITRDLIGPARTASLYILPPFGIKVHFLVAQNGNNADQLLASVNTLGLLKIRLL